jgi:hypothetical protein
MPLTKNDLAVSVADLRREFDDLKREVKQELKEFNLQLNAKTDNGFADLVEQLRDVRDELRIIRWIVGVLIGGVAVILVRLFFYPEPI